MFIDADTRPSIREVIGHRFLTHGTIVGVEESIWNPFELHLKTPPVDILSALGQSSKPSTGDEDLWKRRQLSTLWAPMSTEQVNSTAISVAGKFAYDLCPIIETEEEMGSKFINVRTLK